jgi:dsDNA-specific endonuclease/ATPase MutS2
VPLCALQFSMTILEWVKGLFAGNDVESDAAEDSDLDPFNPFPEPVEIQITDVIDLHTIPPGDVKRVVEEYLHQTHEAGFRTVRIIHGKGIGVQREMVRTILARTTFVEDWTDAPPEAGGMGATIARFRPKS